MKKHLPLVSISILILIWIGMGIYGCAVDSEKTIIPTNKKVQLELMFEHDGCKIYRFEDFGEPVYYADCRGPKSDENTQTSMNWEHRVGKIEHSYQSTTVNK